MQRNITNLILILTVLITVSFGYASSASNEPGRPIEKGLTAREAGNKIGLLILKDVESESGDSLYLALGQEKSYWQVVDSGMGIQSGAPYCIYRRNGFAKENTFAKLVSVSPGHVYTPTGSFQGITFKFEGGIILSIMGGPDSSLRALLDSCMGQRAEFRRTPDAPLPEPQEVFQESSNMVEQLRLFKEKTQTVMNQSRCNLDKEKQEKVLFYFEKLLFFLNFGQETFDELQIGLPNKSIDFNQFYAVLKSKVEKASEGNTSLKVICHDQRLPKYSDSIECSLEQSNRDISKQYERDLSMSFRISKPVNADSEDEDKDKYEIQQVSLVSYNGRHDSSISLQSKAFEAALKRSSDLGSSSRWWRNRVKLFEKLHYMDKSKGIDFIQTSIGTHESVDCIN